jgi:hypothetical protein
MALDVGVKQSDPGPTFLGDGLYAQFDGWQIELYATDGTRKTNSVFLELSVLEQFLQFVQQLRSRSS